MIENHIVIALANASVPCTDRDFGPASCREDFDFTLLFEQSILSILPCTLFLLLVPVRLFLLYRTDVKTHPDIIHPTKLIFSSVYACLQLALLVLWGVSPEWQTRASIPSSALSFVAAIAVILLSHMEHTRSVRPSSLLVVYLMLSAICDSPQVRTLYLTSANPTIAATASTCLGIKVLLLFLEVQSKRNYLKPPYKNYSVETTSGVINLSLSWWLNGLFRTGFRKLMTYDDLFSIDEELNSESLGHRIERTWYHRERSERKYEFPLAVVKCFRREVILSLFPRVCLIGFKYAQPFLITRAIDFVVIGTNNSFGYGLIGATLFVYLGIAITTAQYKQHLIKALTMFRGGTVYLIYKHALSIQHGASEESAAITLMSTDIDTTVEAITLANEIWAYAIETVIGICLLERQLGTFCVVPLIVIAGTAIGQSWVTKHIGGRSIAWNAAIEKRVAVTSSMLSFMKAMKMTGLSTTLRNILHGLRVHELEVAAQKRWLFIWLNLFGSIGPIWSPVITLVAFAITARICGGEALDTNKAFTSLAIISLVSQSAMFLFLALPIGASALGPLKRIQNYLLLPSLHDQRDYQTSSNPSRYHVSDPYAGIELRHLRPSLLSSPPQSVIKLDRITIHPAPEASAAISSMSFSINKGSFVIIIGPVGCGKSTLLKALIGELPYKGGSMMIASKSIAYCSQQPWLLNTTIQQSICGLTPNVAVDTQWYSTVVHACALNEDLAMLPEGDLTVLGSRAGTLSGGQRQRLALARALYARQEILFLDDVLSALDMKTEDLIVTRLFGKNGLLRKTSTTTVLVTHSTRHLQIAEQIFVLDERGNVAHEGNYETLTSKPSFQNMSNFLLHSKNSDEQLGDVQRSNGYSKIKSLAQPEEDELTDLTRRTGDLSVYKYYAKSLGWTSLTFFLASAAIYCFALTFSQVWINWWTNKGNQNLAFYMSGYILLAIIATAMRFSYLWVALIKMTETSSIRLHETLLDAVIGAPLSFFSGTDTGVTLNRFSQDMSLVDNQLIEGVIQTGAQVFMCIGRAALITTGSAYMAITILPLMIIMYFIQHVYLKTSRQLRFLDLEAKSPLYSHFIETLEGLSTIRVFGWQSEAIKKNNQNLDVSQRPYYLLASVQRWLNLVLNLLVAGLAVTVVTLAVNLRTKTSGGLLGVALNNILAFNLALSQLITGWTSLETSLGAIARVKAFDKTTPRESLPEEQFVPAADWPSRGAMEFRNLSVSYSNEDSVPLALKDINISLSPGQKLGICGRTGSGKSTLLLTLFRLLDTYSAGTILVDNVDLRTVPRDIIRQRFTAISQDAFTLSGTVRFNADPDSKCGDDMIVAALAKVRLWDVLSGRGGLDAELKESSLSLGQRQLFCLARALLRPMAKVLVLDEATSHVDKEMDELIQKVVREEFCGCTVLSVAHRIDTIMDSDIIAVMDAGRIVETGKPEILLEKRDGAFRRLCGL